jgi:xylulokinase
MSISIGTVIACVNYTSDFAPKLGCCIGPGLDNNTFYQLAFSSNGAGVLEWYQKNFASNMSIPDLLFQARNVPAGVDGLFALPSADTYPELTGFKNASPKHMHGHYVRAILESNAATLKQHIEQLCNGTMPSHIVATGGGAKSNLWLQIKANMLGTEIVATNCEEPACRGAAVLAAQSLPWFANIDTCLKSWVAVTNTFSPHRQ